MSQRDSEYRVRIDSAQALNLPAYSNDALKRNERLFKAPHWCYWYLNRKTVHPLRRIRISAKMGGLPSSTGQLPSAADGSRIEMPLPQRGRNPPTSPDALPASWVRKESSEDQLDQFAFDWGEDPVLSRKLRVRMSKFIRPCVKVALHMRRS